MTALQRRLENSLKDHKEREAKYDRLEQVRMGLVGEVFSLKAQLTRATHVSQSEQRFQYLVRDMMNTENTDALVLSNIGMGIAGESGEVVDILKKVAHHGHHLDNALRTHLCTEIGDTLFYVEALLQFLRLRKTDCYALVETKLRLRYPEGKFTAEDSINRKQ